MDRWTVGFSLVLRWPLKRTTHVCDLKNDHQKHFRVAHSLKALLGRLMSASGTEKPFDWQTKFLGSYTDDLPHWVVESGRYAVTFRCAGSLPYSVERQMEEQRRLLSDHAPESEAAMESRRQFFRILDAYLDQGTGFAPFLDKDLCVDFSNWLQGYAHEGLRLSDFVIMPNHLHLITQPLHLETVDAFRDVWARFKGRSSRFLNQKIQRSGSFWQSYGYDRWIRNESELARWKTYLQRNPVKAGLCREGEEYPYVYLS